MREMGQSAWLNTSSSLYRAQKAGVNANIFSIVLRHPESANRLEPAQHRQEFGWCEKSTGNQKTF